MQTEHRIVYGDSRELDALADGCIDLVVTSPPYPMIGMWDGLFAGLDPEIGMALGRGRCRDAFEAMHLILDETWCALFRVMSEGAIGCINIGDAVRSMGNRFRLFANSARIQSKLMEIGFDPLPAILWRKQTNAPNKFMGSGMLPAGAYVTLEHEYILIFRKGNRRCFDLPGERKRRRQSSYFWEERNRWFSDLWDFKGTAQGIGEQSPRRRSAAYPFSLPFRLINMYSLIGDTVFDPFLGTATTTLAAMAGGRNSVGYEIDPAFEGPIRQRLAGEREGLNRHNLQRLKDHLGFVRRHVRGRGPLKYVNSYFGFPVMTGQERELKLPFIRSVEEAAKGHLRVTYFEDDYIRGLDPERITLEQLQAQGGGMQQSFRF